MNYGDAAAAVIVGNKDPIAEVEGSYSIFEELQDFWRTDNDTFVRSAEDRFIVDEGYNRIVPMAVKGALERFKLSVKDFSSCVLYIPSQRQLGGVVKKLGFDPKTQSKDSLFYTVGDAGSAMSLLSFIEALEDAKSGNRLLLSCYGNGCDVFNIKVTDNVEKIKGTRRG